MKGKKNSMPPAVPMIWREPICHLEDCCFCLTKIEGDSKKSKVKIQYISIPTAKNTVAHTEEQPIPKTRFLKKSRRNDKLHLLIPVTQINMQQQRMRWNEDVTQQTELQRSKGESLDIQV
jgi:hypothetical protein